MNRNDQNSRNDTPADSGTSTIGSQNASKSESFGKAASDRKPQQGASLDNAPQKGAASTDGRSGGRANH